MNSAESTSNPAANGSNQSSEARHNQKRVDQLHPAAKDILPLNLPLSNMHENTETWHNSWCCTPEDHWAAVQEEMDRP